MLLQNLSLKKCLHLLVFLPIKTLLQTAFSLCAYMAYRWSAYVRRQRSIRAMERLDAHLLNDIGFCRKEGKLVALKPMAHANTVRNDRRKTRLRCAFLLRRRRLKRDLGS